VAFGKADVQLSQRYLVFFRCFSFFVGISLSFQAWALLGEDPVHFSGDRQLWDRAANQVDLIGHATIIQAGEVITADKIHFDMNTRSLDAEGNCTYSLHKTEIVGDEIHLNLDTRVGIVRRGKVSSGRFTLSGNEIYKRKNGVFEIFRGEYTTCHDCESSWSFRGEHVDMTLGGYAFISNVTAKVKGVPVVWLPYALFPMKSERQTGFLFPSFAKSTQSGTVFMLPFFWKLGRSADMTLGAGIYSLRGQRATWETRYVLSERSHAQSNFYFLRDRSFLPQKSMSRWALDLSQTQELPFGIDEKIRIQEVSDNIYPLVFGSDLPNSSGEAFLPSTLTFARNTADFSVFVAMKRYRNLINTTPNNFFAQNISSDPRTVQVFPRMVITTNDQLLGTFGGVSIISGLSVGLSHFTRTGGLFDYDASSVPFGTVAPSGLAFRPGIDPIRQGTRFTLNPSLYTTLRPWDLFSLVPSLQYQQYFYDFTQNVSSLSRGYLLFQTELMAQWERIFRWEESHSSSKHIIRPILTYSFIPYLKDNPNHPFVRQIQQLQNSFFTQGYNFDDYDIIAYGYQRTGANYFMPLGNSLAYGFTTQWIQKKESPKDHPVYQTTAEWMLGHGINFLEMYHSGDPKNRQLLTRLFSGLTFNFNQFRSQTAFYYYPDLSSKESKTLSTSLTYVLDRGLHEKVLVYDRSLTLTYGYNMLNAGAETSNLSATLNFSINDYILPSGGLNYSFVSPSPLLGANLGLNLQSPSRCWKVGVLSSYAPAVSGQKNIIIAFNLGLNFSGSGFSDVSQMSHSQTTY
jgi:lipopolysaccharide assembly outer membrane protein LptD (OstA)